MTAPSHLGDSHNFGRRVTMKRDRVHKPRAVLWEWLLPGRREPPPPLSSTKPPSGTASGRLRSAFCSDLAFFPAPSSAPIGGEVERIALAPLGTLSAAGRHALARVVGRALALFAWLGLSDLHWENLVLGVAEDGRVIFAPLDVEMILADLSLPTETKLLPDADPEYAAICRHACGVRRVLPYLGKPVTAADLLAIAGAYATMLAFLDRHGAGIAEVFARLPGLKETPIRVCLRGTGDYVRAHAEPLWPPLLDAESEQLARGDIPYFFRLYGQPGIHYYASEDLARRKRIPLAGDVPQLDPILQVARGLRSPSRRKLREEGLFTVLGAFDHPSFSGVHAGEELEVAFKPRTLVVKVRTGTKEELETRRNLSAFVGSVYLPCRCGEVRSVFVPPVTACENAR